MIDAVWIRARFERACRYGGYPPRDIFITYVLMPWRWLRDRLRDTVESDDEIVEKIRVLVLMVMFVSLTFYAPLFPFRGGWVIERLLRVLNVIVYAYFFSGLVLVSTLYGPAERLRRRLIRARAHEQYSSADIDEALAIFRQFEPGSYEDVTQRAPHRLIDLLIIVQALGLLRQRIVKLRYDHLAVQ